MITTKLTRCFLAGAALLGAVALRANTALLNDAKSWKPMGTEDMRVAWSDAEGALHFQAAFSKAGQHSVWPLVPLPAGMAGAAGIRFEMKLLPEGLKDLSCRVHFADQGALSGHFSFAPPVPGAYQPVELHFERAGFDMAKVRSLQMVVSTTSLAIDCYIRNIAVFNAKNEVMQVAREDPSRVMKLTTGDDLLQFYAQPEQPQRIEFATGHFTDGQALSYDITDYAGAAVVSGASTVVADGRVAISVTLPRGYYELRFPDADLVFGLTVLEPYDGAPDPFFAIEGLISTRSEERIRQTVAVLLRAGIRSNREWCNYAAEEPVQGEYKIARESFYGIAGDMGLKSIFCFNDFPRWYGGEPVNDRYVMPRHLLGLVPSVSGMLDRRAAGLEAFHILNEYDARSIPGEAHLPIIKAAAYAMRGRDLLMVAAPFCRGESARDCVRAGMDNGLLDSIDVFAFHNYGAPEKLVPLIQTYRDMLASHPKGRLPMWITECGKPWSRGLDPSVQLSRPHGGPLGKLHPERDEDMVSALWITMKGVEARAAGIAKYFPFTMPFFQENNNNFGMMDYHATPLRSLAAYMLSVQQLALKDYVGDWPTLPANAMICRVFKGISGAVAVIYTGDIEERMVSIADMPATGAWSIDGRPLALADGAIRFAGGLAYVGLDAVKLNTAALNMATAAMALRREALSYEPQPRVATPVVYQFDHWQVESWDGGCYHADSDRFSVNVYNFSDDEQRIAPQLQLPAGASVVQAPTDAARVLPPRSETPLTWTLDFSGCKDAYYSIRLHDTGFPLAGCSVPFVNWSFMAKKTFDFMNPERWRQNSSGASTFSFDAVEQALKVSTTFAGSNSDRWVFPEYVLDAGSEELANAVGIGFSIKVKRGGDVGRIWSPLVMMAYQDENEKGKYDGLRYTDPTEEWREVFVSVNPERARLYKMIRVGMCTSSDQIDYWLKDVVIYFRP